MREGMGMATSPTMTSWSLPEHRPLRPPVSTLTPSSTPSFLSSLPAFPLSLLPSCSTSYTLLPPSFLSSFFRFLHLPALHIPSFLPPSLPLSSPPSFIFSSLPPSLPLTSSFLVAYLFSSPGDELCSSAELLDSPTSPTLPTPVFGGCWFRHPGTRTKRRSHCSRVSHRREDG